MFVTPAMSECFKENNALRRRADKQKTTLKAIQNDVDGFADHIDAGATAKIFLREDWAKSSVPFVELNRIYQASRIENIRTAFTIMADFRDSFRLINRLQEVLLRVLKKYRETEDFTDEAKIAAYDNLMGFYLDQFHVVKDTHEDVTEVLPHLARALEELKRTTEPREQSEAFMFCERMNAKISDDMGPDLHTQFNIDAHILAAKASHRWAKSRLDATDADLALMYYLAPPMPEFLSQQIISKMPVMEANWKKSDEKINLAKTLLNSIVFPNNAAAPAQTSIPAARYN